MILKKFEHILFGYGIGLELKTKLSKICNIANRVCLCTLWLIFVVFQAGNSFQKFEFRHCELIFTYVYCFHFIYLIASKRKDILSLNKLLVRLTPGHVSSYVRRIASKYVVIWLCVYFIDTILSPITCYVVGVKCVDETMSDRLHKSFTKYSFGVKMFMITFWLIIANLKYYLTLLMTLIYVLYIHSFETLTTDFIKALSHNRSEGRGHDRSYLLLLSKTKTMFENTFSTIPLCKFVFTFLQTTTYFLMFRKNSPGIIASVYAFYVWNINTWSTLAILFAIENGNKRIKICYDDMLIATQHDESKVTFSLEVEKTMKLEFTAWKLFSLDKSLVLHLISAMLTFSILFLQIVNGN